MVREGREHARFAGVANFLERVPIECSHELFHDSERASQKAASFLDTSRLIGRREGECRDAHGRARHPDGGGQSISRLSKRSRIASRVSPAVIPASRWTRSVGVDGRCKEASDES